MLITCTRKMYGYVGGSERIGSHEYDSLFTWSGELFHADDGNAYVMLRNLYTGFPILFQVSRKTLVINSEQILAEIGKAFLAQGYDNNAIEVYLKEGEAVRFTRKSDQPVKKKLDALIASTCEIGFDKAPSMLPKQVTTQNRKKVVSSDLMREALDEQKVEITKKLNLVVPLKATLQLTPGYNVWRSFLLPPTLTMYEVHRVLQIAFAWDDDHLHEFRVGKHIRISEKNEEKGGWFDRDEFYDESEVQLQHVVGLAPTFTYIYDFGDYWVHTIKVEKPKFIPEEPVAVCTGGEGASPWEDCGGAYGFDEMMGILADPEHEQYEEILDWSGGIEEREFDQLYINARLLQEF
jgi:hypothetical protein